MRGVVLVVKSLLVAQPFLVVLVAVVATLQPLQMEEQARPIQAVAVRVHILWMTPLNTMAALVGLA
jgi:hypothetical protein